MMMINGDDFTRLHIAKAGISSAFSFLLYRLVYRPCIRFRFEFLLQRYSLRMIFILS